MTSTEVRQRKLEKFLGNNTLKYKKINMKRTIYITGEITSALADSVQLEIDKCLAENVSEIEFRVNSPGGSVGAGVGGGYGYPGKICGVDGCGNRHPPV